MRTTLNILISFLFFLSYPISAQNNSENRSKNTNFAREVALFEKIHALQKKAEIIFLSGLEPVEKTCKIQGIILKKEEKEAQIDDFFIEKKQKTLVSLYNQVTPLELDFSAKIQQQCSLIDSLVSKDYSKDDCETFKENEKNLSNLSQYISQTNDSLSKINQSLEVLMLFEKKQCVSEGFSEKIRNTYIEFYETNLANKLDQINVDELK